MTPLLSALAAALRTVAPLSPEETPLGAVSAVIVRMARSYLSDGEVFFARGDDVNAHASAAYAFGWLDAGAYIGFYQVRNPGEDRSFDGMVPEGQQQQLQEKTERYERLLCEALRSLSPAPDPETPMYSAAVRILSRAQDALEQGKRLRDEGRTACALGWFSCGFGWLDAGVQAGIFSVVGSREIFTV
ncbi:MAG: uncharacterized protein PWP08_55 [Methanofollis sp.]|nr:uncharacterized protein [Methanofollis sp.]